MYPVTLSKEAQDVWAVLASPQALAKVVGEYQNIARYADLLLPTKWPTANGMVAIHEAPDTKAAHGVEKVAPGASYPIAALDDHKAILKEMELVGRAAEITLQKLRQNLWRALDLGLNEVAYSVGHYRNLSTFATLAAAKTKMHQVAGTSWATIKDAKPVAQVLEACMSIVDMQRGYEPNTLVLPSSASLAFATSDEVMKLLARYSNGENKATWNGKELLVGEFALNVVTVPKNVQLSDPMVIDNQRVGGQAVHVDADQVTDKGDRKISANGVTVEATWYGRTMQSPAGHTNVWYIAGDDETNPFVDTPKAAAVITGTA